MNSPNTKNMYQANSFMTMIRKRYKADISFVLGNHDMIVKGLSIGGRQRTKVIAYLLGEKIKVIEKDKIVLVKIDSNAGGNLARGMITKKTIRPNRLRTCRYRKSRRLYDCGLTTPSCI